MSDYYYTDFTVPYGNTVTLSGRGATIHATGTCTIAGTVVASAAGYTNVGTGGGGGGGGGGGTSAGGAGYGSQLAANGITIALYGGGSGGASSGGDGQGVSSFYGAMPRQVIASAGTLDGLFVDGGLGGLGFNNPNTNSGKSSSNAGVGFHVDLCIDHGDGRDTHRNHRRQRAAGVHLRPGTTLGQMAAAAGVWSYSLRKQR